MFQFINNTYFDNLTLSLPNTDPTKGDGLLLIQTIERLQFDYLNDILGVEMTTDFLNGIVNVTNQVPTASANWLLLLFGNKDIATNIYNGWLGFSNHQEYQDLGTFRRVSPFANYVYYYWICQKMTTTMGQGEATPKFENATNDSSKMKLIKAWNNMVDLHYTMHDFIMTRPSDYPKYIGIKYPPLTDITAKIENVNQKYFIKQNRFSI